MDLRCQTVEEGFLLRRELEAKGMHARQFFQDNNQRRFILTRRFIGDEDRRQPAGSIPDQVVEFVCGAGEPRGSDDSWSLFVCGAVFYYDNNPECVSPAWVEIPVVTGSGNRFLDYYRLLPKE